ncbi:MAG: hypothetical protein E6G97_08940 [Alphaproteobacteria bacterium]|nr:MAG: hypothetical protein E6G97_08940 [Alphaproteobacteria bacterium]
MGADVDKAEFVRRAPGYYVAAIAYALEGIPFPFTREKLSERLGGNSSLGNDIIFDAAIRELRRIGVIEVQSDDFAPTLYQGGSTFDDWWRSDEAGKQFPIIGRLHGIFPDDRRDWLREALGSLNQKAWTFSLRPEDFENEPPDEWEPIPIDRRDPAFQAVDAALKRR